MVTQNNKKNTLNNLKTVYQLHTNGEIISLLRDIRENISSVDEFSSNVKKNIKQAEEKKIILEQEEKKLTEQQQKEKITNDLSEKSQQEKLAERKLFEEQIMKINKKLVQPQNNKQNHQKFDQKRTFINSKSNSMADSQKSLSNSNSNKINFNNQKSFNNQKTFNTSTKPLGSNQRFVGQNSFKNTQKTFQGRTNSGFQQKTYNNKPFSKLQFSTTKANSFKKFDAPKDVLIIQQERNYTNKNKSNFRQFDEKRQSNKKVFQRRNYIDLDINNEERVTVRKLVKPKKKPQTFVATTITHAVITTETISVKNLSEKIGKPSGEIIKKLMLLGIMATINSSIDFTTAEVVSSDLGVTLEQKLEQSYEEKLHDVSIQEDDKNAIKRPPVVTVMGHVDHGKTSLLDVIRRSKVAGGEAGGITQKIGAYSISTKGQNITFIDTPGHEAFTAMRARGAKITDIAILVVAADDGIMPQTIEAINHIKEAKVPMIVAINKMDIVGANPEKIKSQLAENGVLPEEWGGDAIIVPISAKTGVGIDNLIDSILLVAEIQDLKANPDKMATGTIIEAELDKNRGPIATILVQSGTLKVGDNIMSGLTFGKVKAMFNENGKQVKNATPSMPVSILGFADVPNSGDQVFAVDEKFSKNVIRERETKLKEEQSKKTSGVSLDDFMDKVNEGKLKALNIIIKADVQGSVEALKQTLTAVKNEEVKVVCIHSGVGNVTESDLVLAEASKAIIINFNLKVLPKIQILADHMKVEIKQYKVIYEIIEDITKALSGMMTVKYEQVISGHAEVRAVFKLSTYGLIAGCYVTDGKIIKNAIGRLIRNKEIISETEIVALKIVKDEKSEVNAGFECGIKLDGITSLQEGDIIECYENIPIKR